jgi:thiamine-monophosphate kinase
LFLAGQHGEFELLFTVPEDREHGFLRSAEELPWTPLRIGRVIHEPSIQVPLYGSLASLDTGRIRNLGNRFGGEIASYVKQLMNIDFEIQKGASHHVNQ